MNGGPSQMDTFDLKPGHANGGPFKEIATSVPGIKISEHLPKVAKHDDTHGRRPLDDHQGGRPRPRPPIYMRTGYLPQGPIQYPTLGSLVSKELGSDDAALPNFVSIAPYRFFNPAAYGPGFLGPQYAPLIVGDANVQLRPGGQADYEQALKVQDLRPARGRRPTRSADARLDLLHGHGERLRRQPPRRRRRRATRPPTSGPSRLMTHRRRQGVRPRRGEGRAARRLRPQPVRPGLPAGPPAGRARRAVRRGDARRRQRRRRSAGTRTSTTSTRSSGCATSSTRPGPR